MAVEKDKSSEDEALIRARAHKIWETEGRPHGKDKHHWEQARQERAGESQPPAGGREAATSSSAQSGKPKKRR
jgi:hypothetical protein